MPNSDTEHSRQLRQKTAAQWQKEMIQQGGMKITVLLPPGPAEKLRRLAGSKSIRTTIIELIESAPEHI